ncbi:mediator of RNA polymerase II transcription subunit 27 [Trichonephila inaurata madagascariensis]|uniref:Mediator of RNA polymerase II transcription subunit 27 n=1 Tax=Trichonephila inaurata madagascariensis TaxID=2747483 RepID=A0A8X6X6P9_9ARAC|nr:mediator of RNA polymerase II transcription subunit 27 [Trichonephila inaurata madagascariensis]
MDEVGGINLGALHSGLKAVRALRSTVLEVFKLLGDGATAAYGDEERAKFINEVQATLASVKVRMRELETAGTLLELIKSHRWFDKVYELSSHATSIFSQNSLKRAHFSTLTSSKQMRPRPTGHNRPPQSVDLTTTSLTQYFPDIQMQVLKPYGNSTIIMVSVARTLKALIMLRGLIIDWVIVKGYNEEFYNENDKLDMWSGSRYLVFQKVTEHANAAMLHFYSPNLPELAVRSFLTWIRSYGNLFTAPCRKCGNRLHNNMPPTWRDVRNLDVYHESCKP